MIFAHVSVVFGGIALFKHADVVLMLWDKATNENSSWNVLNRCIEY